MDRHINQNVNNYRNAYGDQNKYEHGNAATITDAISVPNQRRISGQSAEYQ